MTVVEVNFKSKEIELFKFNIDDKVMSKAREFRCLIRKGNYILEMNTYCYERVNIFYLLEKTRKRNLCSQAFASHDKSVFKRTLYSWMVISGLTKRDAISQLEKHFDTIDSNEKLITVPVVGFCGCKKQDNGIFL